MDQILKKVKAVIFDMDGTILDTERVWHAVTCKVLSDHGINVEDESIQPFLHSLAGIGLKEAVHAVKNKFVIPESADELISYKQRLANDFFAGHISFINGFEQFHELLRLNNIPSSIATNATQSNLDELNRRLQLNKFFGNNLYCIAQVNNRAKPDPSVFLYAADMLGVRPQECIVFEDSIYGFKAAEAAGMKCIAIKNKINAEHRRLAHDEIDDYSQALAALDRVSR